MYHESLATPEKDTDRQKVFIKRSDGNIHSATLTGEKDEHGRSIVGWTELDPETDKMVERFKPIAEQGLGSEAQDVLRMAYEQRLNAEMGGAALGAVDDMRVEEAPVEESDSDALELLLEKTPILREFSTELRKIANMRAREEKEGHAYGMNQYASSEAMIDKLVDLMGQVQKSKLGEDRRGAIYKYIDHLL